MWGHGYRVPCLHRRPHVTASANIALGLIPPAVLMLSRTTVRTSSKQRRRSGNRRLRGGRCHGRVTTRCELGELTGYGLRRFQLVGTVRDALRDRLIQPLSDWGSSGRRFKSCQPDRGKQRLSCGNECASASHRSNHATLGECWGPRARCKHLGAHVSAGQVVAGSVLAVRSSVCAALLAPGRERTLSRAQGVNVRRWGARQRSLCRS